MNNKKLKIFTLILTIISLAFALWILSRGIIFLYHGSLGFGLFFVAWGLFSVWLNHNNLKRQIMK